MAKLTYCAFVLVYFMQLLSFTCYGRINVSMTFSLKNEVILYAGGAAHGVGLKKMRGLGWN